jgi:hypothetical protein
MADEVLKKSGWSVFRGLKRKAFVLALVILCALPALTFGGSFKVYPGARVEDIYEEKQPGGGGKTFKNHKVIIFTTNDFFENVVAFYRGNAREYRIPGGGRPIKLSSGRELKEAYFILDEAGDIMTSTHWIKIQRPYLVRGRTGEGFRGKYETVRDVTAIIEEDKRSYP